LTRRALLLSVLLLFPSACASVGTTQSAAGPAMVVDRLFFGTNIPSGGRVSDDEWRSFVREVVTPRFKDGLTIFEANGQWLDPRGELVREHVMVVEVAHKPASDVEASIRDIANEYKKRFKQDAVLRMTVPATMTLY